MAKTSRADKTDIVRVGTNAGFLTRFVAEDKSLETMGDYVIVPRLKIIQSMTDQKLKDQFNEGSVIIRPGDGMVWRKNDEPFQFVPQFFFVEYCKWADMNDKTVTSKILERTYDGSSELAKRCADKERREEIYPGQEGRPAKEQQKYRYVQHFCFPGVLYGDHALAGQKVVMSFERGEFGQGRNFISAIKMRRERIESEIGMTSVKPPLWSQVWQFTVGFRAPDQRKWYGFDFEQAGIINDIDADAFQQEHLELQRLHEENKLRVDRSDESGDDESSPGSTMDEAAAAASKY